MAAAGTGSRWDGLVTTNNRALQRQYDTDIVRSNTLLNAPNSIRTKLIDQKINIGDDQYGIVSDSIPTDRNVNVFEILQVFIKIVTIIELIKAAIDPWFYDCYYGIANSQVRIVEHCYKDIGCCQYGCCDNVDWHVKYGWAVALIVIFCILVVIAFVIWLIVWLINRSKDKRQKQDLIYEQSAFASPTLLQRPLAETRAPIEKYDYELPCSNVYRY
ncbi:hypothetical protein DICVIV_01766 [Dictyocaulus viviparus]|uniref:CX domain-containing protein n=1 Tax=Dictyocaulus viviparus TaxID=29172 RepID=A0A0D8Y7U3_DICVI|nr:hypothetical protein DICVIV_01766 [Dictyocaulus viviparus]